ncbi:MAG: DUF4440 domain-containing protein [Anaerolineae bacterium]|nr:DUF4440 domain-containing protein [Anaerolineae bacterium]
MQSLYEKEIRELHAFFRTWYRGTVNDSDESFSRIEDVLASEFTLITADGYVVARDQLLGLLRSEYATKNPDIEMWVENIQLRLATDDIVLVSYEEHGITTNGKKSTLITALLRKNPKRQNGLEWIHIHEVRLPDLKQE